jgi:energy-coupling factor transporter ATP-binding protein EcfA2
MKIVNVGAIKRLEIPLKRGVVTVLKGPNGSGKSTALSVVEAVATGKRGGLTPRDGKKYGTIEVPGCVLKLGARITARGEATESYVIVEDGAGLGVLIDPGIKDVHSADRARLKALLSSAGATVDLNAVKSLLGDMYETFAKEVKLPDDVMEMVAAVRKWVQARALKSEKRCNEIDGSLAEIGELPELTEDVPDVDGCRQKAAEADQSLKSAKAKQESQQAALAALESFSADTVSVEDLQIEESGLKRESERLQAELLKVTERLSVVKDRIISGIEAKQKFDRLKAQVDDIVTDEQVSNLGADAERLTAEYEAAVTARDNRKSIEKSIEKKRGLEEERDDRGANADRCRDLASDAFTLLHQALEQFDGWSVDEDFRLCVRHSRGDQTPYGDLSPGERAIRAIEVVLPQFVPGESLPVVALPQEVFESLDAKNRELFFQFVADRGFAAVTAEASRRVDSVGIEVEEMAATAVFVAETSEDLFD